MTASPTRGPEQLIEEGTERFDAGQLLEAVRLWREAVRLKPGDLRASAYLAWGEAELHASMTEDHGAPPLAPPPATKEMPMYGPDDDDPTYTRGLPEVADFTEEPTQR